MVPELVPHLFDAKANHVFDDVSQEHSVQQRDRMIITKKSHLLELQAFLVVISALGKSPRSLASSRTLHFANEGD
jgi:hypothetical protein